MLFLVKHFKFLILAKFEHLVKAMCNVELNPPVLSVSHLPVTHFLNWMHFTCFDLDHSQNMTLFKIINIISLPIKCNFVSQSFVVDISIQHVVANVSDTTLHPLDGNWTICTIEIVLQKFIGIWWLFPVKLLCNFSPEFCRLID